MGKLSSPWKPKLIREFLEGAEDTTRWIVPNFIPCEALVLVSGPRKLAWKTWLADFLTLVVAEGIQCGPVTPALTGPVIYFEEEGTARGTAERWAGFERTFELNLKESENLFYVFRDRVRLDDEAWTKKIIGAVQTLKPLMVVFDALTYMHGADENKTVEMRPVVETLQRIRALGTTCLFLTHTNTAGSQDPKMDEDMGVRGSKVILDAYDVHLALRRFRDSDPHIKLKVRQREGSQRVLNVTWDLRTEVDEEEQIEQVMHVMPHFSDVETQPEFQRKQRVDLLAEMVIGTMYSFGKLQEITKLTKKRLTRELNQLLEQEKIAAVKNGKHTMYKREE